MTDLHQRLTLPRERSMCCGGTSRNLLPKKMRESELLFPSVMGGFRARSALDKSFDEVSKAIRLKFNFTPRGMRRTYQDLARAARIHDAVKRAISGYATPAMQLHHSTASGDEVKHALAKVASDTRDLRARKAGAAAPLPDGAWRLGAQRALKGREHRNRRSRADVLCQRSPGYRMLTLGY